MKDSLRRSIFALLLAFALFGVCCDRGDYDPPPPGTEVGGFGVAGDDDDDNDDNDDETACDASLRPVIFVYGIMENGDSFSTQSMRFTSNGYCRDRLFTYDWNAFSGYWNESPRFARYVAAVSAATGATQVDVISHSLGAGVVVGCLSDPAGASRIAHYAQVAAVPCLAIPPTVPSLNLSSVDDRIVGVCEPEGADNLVLSGVDHLQTVTSAETFAELFTFFNDGRQPATTEVVPEEPILLSGRTVMYMFNEPIAGTEIRIFEVDAATGERLSAAPDAVLTSDADGSWGDFLAEPGAYYEFVCLDPLGEWPPAHTYREPFVRSNNNVYFRVYPPKDSWFGVLFSLLPTDDSLAKISWTSINRSVITGRDTFAVDGIDLATPEVADADFTTLYVMFDDLNANGLSDHTVLSLLPSRNYIKLYDLHVGTQTRRSVVFEFDGRRLAVPNWKALSEGVSTVVFE
ncbi:MAG: hypothetical protein P9L99_17110 [Candidatus Lernaella stagnicola]|nr:hypothetical protein [Candidatus Lernaella stagnicola]